MLAHIADLMKGNPRIFPPILQRRRVCVCRKQRAKWRRAEFLFHKSDRSRVVVGAYRFIDDIEMDRAEDGIIGLVA